MKTGGKSSHAPAGEGNITIFKYTQTVQDLPSREAVSPEPKLLRFHQSLTDLGEGKYPTSAPSRLPVSPKG